MPSFPAHFWRKVSAVVLIGALTGCGGGFILNECGLKPRIVATNLG